jgi:hypothetical protein
MEIAAVQGGTLDRIFEFEVGAEAVALAAEEGVLQQGTFLHREALMVFDFPIAIKGRFFRPPMNHGLVLVADQAADIQPADGFFIVPENGGGQFGGYGIARLKELGEMALGAGEVGLGGLRGRLDRQNPLFEIFGHEDPVIHSHQGPGMMRLFPLGVNLPVTLPAPPGIIAGNQFLQRPDFIFLPFAEKIEGHQENDCGGK